MTDKLRDSMQARADAAGFAPIDFGAVVAGGRRKVRRRRTAAVASGVVGAAAVLALVVSLAGAGPERADIAPADPFPTQPRSFEPIVTAGARVYVGSEVITLDDPVYRLVRDADALVYQSDVDPDAGVAAIHAWKNGTTTDLGRGRDLTADHDGHLAAWIDDADLPQLVVLDTRAMTTRTIELQSGSAVGPGEETARLHDVDGSTVYLTDGRGGIALDLVTGTTQPVEGYVVDVEDGVVVTADVDTLDQESGGGERSPGAGVTASTGGSRTLLAGVTGGILSPDGRWLATPDVLPETGTPGAELLYVPGTDLVDTTTGRRFALDIASAVTEPAFTVQPAGWLDSDTITVFWSPAESEDPERLLACDVTSGTCEVAVDDTDTLPGTRTGLLTYPGSPPFDRR